MTDGFVSSVLGDTYISKTGVVMFAKVERTIEV